MTTEDYSLHSPFSEVEGDYLDANYGGGSSPVTSVAGRTGDVVLVKGDVGLGSVDNTADTAKPVSTAQQAEFDLKENTSGNDLTTGQSTMRRREVASSSVGVTNQTLRLTYFTAKKSETSTQVRTITGSTAAGATPTLCRIGLYTVAGNGDLTLVASTANDTTLWAATATIYTKSWSSSIAITRGTRYALGILCVTGATAPAFQGNNAINATESFTEPKLSAVVSGQSDLPSSVANGSLTSNANSIYSVILP